jgi:CheY-like chemotaxis protein/AraC-like DNA-binding protein
LKSLVLIPLCCLLFAGVLSSQITWRDSLNTRIGLLKELTQSGNLERAQLEAGELRRWMREKFILCPAEAVPLISDIYWRNKDRQNGQRFLAEAEQDAQRNRNPETRAALLRELVKAQSLWGNSERAIVNELMLKTAQDSLETRRVNKQTNILKKQVDSLARIANELQMVKDNTLTVEKWRAGAVLGTLLAIMLALFVVNARNNYRWKQRLDDRDREWELRMAVEPALAPTPPPSIVEAPPTVESVTVAAASNDTTAYQNPRSAAPPFGEYDLPHALVIEPNRHVALYVRSLLNDRFEVEIVKSPAEGLQRAHELLPDLIVCDAQLEGQTGIDITRQIKLSDRTNHIPIVLLSRYHGNEGRLDALRAGADAWFTRPMLSEEFGSTVKHLLDGQKDKHEVFNRFLQLYFTTDRIKPANRFLADLVGHIEQNLSNADLMPDELARRMNMTNVHFVKKLLALTGKEPQQLVRELRLEKAKFLLLNRAGTPQAIAELTGFDNPGTFSMAFKDYFGENTLLLKG